MAARTPEAKPIGGHPAPASFDIATAIPRRGEDEMMTMMMMGKNIAANKEVVSSAGREIISKTTTTTMTMENDEEFAPFIRELLKLSDLDDKYVDAIVLARQRYTIAFTTPLVDPENNYEVYEYLGDKAADHFLSRYFYDRFPQYRCAGGAGKYTRLRAIYASGVVYGAIAERLGFIRFVRAAAGEKERPERRAKILKDVFEAFVAATELIVDDLFPFGTGYNVIYKILKYIYDDQYPVIGTEDTDLIDARTRVKEFVERHSAALGPTVRYDRTKVPGAVIAYVIRPMGGRWDLATSDVYPDQTPRNITDEDAAERAIATLKRAGYEDRVEFRLACEPRPPRPLTTSPRRGGGRGRTVPSRGRVGSAR
jgi:dsRNA-specific ribonuclease